MRQLRPEAADLLREIVNIGASQGSGVLAARVGRPVRITVPMLRELELEESASVFGPPEDPVEAVLVLSGGAFHAGIMLALTESDLRRLSESLGFAPESRPELDHSLAQVLETFLVGAGAFLMTDLSVEVSRSLYDMAGSLVPSLVGELEYEIDSIILAEVDFLTETATILGRLFFLGDAGFYDLIDELAG